MKEKPELVEEIAPIVIPLVTKRSDVWVTVCPLLEAALKLQDPAKVIALFNTIKLEKIKLKEIAPSILAKSLIALANVSRQLKNEVSKLLQQSKGKINLSVLDFSIVMSLVELFNNQPVPEKKMQLGMSNS